MRVIGLLLIACFILLSGNSNAATITATSCSYSDVSAAVSSASPGDTVQVPAGSCTWSSTLTLNKGVNLTGAGAGSTIITRDNGNAILISQPANTYLLRISGFTFTTGPSGGPLIRCANNERNPPSYTIRIDHNKFTNSGTCLTGHCAFINEGCRGVIDNNTFERMQYPLGLGTDTFPGKWAWSTYPDLVYGAANDNIYVEDNTFADMTTTLTDGDEGGRYVLRYNTITLSADMWPILDTHNGLGGVYGTMGVEVYGNLIVTNGHSATFTDYRGGRCLTFLNLCSGSRGCSNKVSNNEGCPPPPIDRQNINTSYYFANRNTSGLMGFSKGGDACPSQPTTENVKYWRDASPFTGAAGTGCGILENRPATCTTGVAYWATNQSCTNLTGMIGANPSTPISGTLYKCTSPNTWTAFYIPFTYPHPLRVGGGAQSPSDAAPSNLTVR